MEYSSEGVLALVKKAHCTESKAKMYLLDKVGVDRQEIASSFGYDINTVDGYIRQVECSLNGEPFCMLDHYSNSFG